jgi:hypothetical protein
MDIEKFLSEEPQAKSQAISALWWQAKGDWDKAHKLVQSGDENNNWVHAYLHRVEGDLSNAAHWYGRANKPVCETELNEEWTAILSALSE